MMQEDLFRQAVALARTGKKNEARSLLERVLRDNPRNEAAWLWYADCAPSLTERVHALETCLRIIPDAHIAQMGLEKLRHELTARTEPKVQAPAAQDAELAPGELAKTQKTEPEPGSLTVPLRLVPAIPGRKAVVPSTPPEHRLPVKQFPAPGSPTEVSMSHTQPVRVTKEESASQPQVLESPGENQPAEQVSDEQRTTSATAQGVSSQAYEASAAADTQEAQLKEEKPPALVKIFDRELPRDAEPNPFTVTPGDYPRAAAHTPVIKPLKAQIERRLERDLGLDVPLPPEPTQRIRVHPKQATTSRGMFLLYIALVLIGILGIAALLAGLILSGR